MKTKTQVSENGTFTIDNRVPENQVKIHCFQFHKNVMHFHGIIQDKSRIPSFLYNIFSVVKYLIKSHQRITSTKYSSLTE